MVDETKLLYTDTHEWAQLRGEICTIGITRFAVEQLTDIVYVELPKVGAKVSAGKPFGVIESVKAVSDLVCPLDGEVIEANQAVANDPAILSSDPYNNGWMIRVRASNTVDSAKFLSKAAYDRFTAEQTH